MEKTKGYEYLFKRLVCSELNKNYTMREVLIHLHIDNDMSSTQIAKEYRISKQLVNSWFNKYGITKEIVWVD